LAHWNYWPVLLQQKKPTASANEIANHLYMGAEEQQQLQEGEDEQCPQPQPKNETE